MLVCVLEYSQTDAAKKLGMSENAFYAMLHRARLWIRKVYGSEYEELNRFLKRQIPVYGICPYI